MMDARLAIGALFIVGYYASIWIVGFKPMPVENVALIKDAMLQLGPPVGVIVGALFRSDRNDEKRTENTKAAFDAIAATANNVPTAPQPVKVVNDTTEPVPVEGQQ